MVYELIIPRVLALTQAPRAGIERNMEQNKSLSRHCGMGERILFLEQRDQIIRAIRKSFWHMSFSEVHTGVFHGTY